MDRASLPEATSATGARALPPRPRIAGSTLPLISRTGQHSTADDWLADLAALTNLGFRHVDLADTWLAPGDLAESSTTELSKVLAELNLNVVGLSLIRRSVMDPTDWQENLAYTKRSMEAAVRIGAPVVSIGFHRPLTKLQREWNFWEVPGPRDDPSAFSEAVARLRSLATRAKVLGIRLSLELYEGTLIGSGRAAVRLVREVDSESLGINADLANLYRVPQRLSEGWVDTLRACLPYLNYWHVKNYKRAEVYPDGPHLAWPTALGDGDINYRLALQLAVEANYSGPLCVEHHGGDALWFQQRGLEYLTQLVDELWRSKNSATGGVS